MSTENASLMASPPNVHSALNPMSVRFSAIHAESVHQSSLITPKTPAQT